MNFACFKSIAVISFVFITATLSTLILFNQNKQSTIILNDYSGSRLGDQLIGYSKAKWLSYKYAIPFKLIPFHGSEELNVSHEEKYTNLSNLFNRIFYKFFGQRIRINSEEELVAALATLKKPTLFLVHMGTRLCEHINNNAGTDAHDNAWRPSVIYELMRQNPPFSQELKKMLQPLTPINHMNVPKDRMTIAVHLRKGGGFDPSLASKQYFDKQFQVTQYEQIYSSPKDNNFLPYLSKNIPSCFYDPKNTSQAADKQYLDKFPPEQYYVNQIQNISNLFGDIPLYVYIFTDDQNPIALMKRIEKNVNKPNILFDCRTEKNRHNTNVIYDMHAMADFDCLIRSGSHFAYISQLVGNHKIAVYPLHLTWINSEILWVDRVGVIIRTEAPPQKKFGDWRKNEIK